MSHRQRAVVVRDGEGLILPIGRSSVRLLSVGEDTGDLSSTEEIRVPPKFAGPPPHFHERTNHSWFVTEGQLRLTVAGESHDLAPGGFVYVPVGVSHAFANLSSDFAAMVEFTTPGGFDRYLSELTDAFPAGTDIDSDRMVEIMARYDTYPTPDNRT